MIRLSLKRSSLAAVFLTSGLLIGCNTPVTPPVDPPVDSPVDSVVGKGDATLRGDLIQSNRGAAVAGSVAKLYKSGGQTVVGQVTTDAQGQFSFANIPAGTYDLTFTKANYAGSSMKGVVIGSKANLNLKVAQFLAADPNATTAAPSLKVQSFTLKGDGTPVYADLAAGTAFKDTVNVRAYTLPDSAHQRPMRYYLMSLVQFDAQGNWSDYRPGNGIAGQDPGYIVPGPTPEGSNNGEDSGPITLDPAGSEGDLYVQVVGLDFNYNRVAYLIPISVTYSGAAATAQAVTDVKAVAYTLAQAVNYLFGTDPVTDAADAGGNLWVTVSWKAPSVEGVRGFKVLRSSAKAGPYQQVAFIGAKQCGDIKDSAVKNCSVNDNTSTLKTGQDYWYKVVTVASTTAESTVTDIPSTHTLPAFKPSLVAPADNAQDVALDPTYVIHSNAFEIGATGAQFQVMVQDYLLGSSLPWSAVLTTRQVKTQAGAADTQILATISGKNYLVYSDQGDPANNVAGITFDKAKNTLSFKHNYDGMGTGLQPNRRYSWALNKSYAYRIQDMSQPVDAVKNPIVAYAIFTDPAESGAGNCPARPVVPGGACQRFGETFDFTTRK